MKKPIPFGKYFLLDRIAVGGMAEVFKAKVLREEGFEKLFAIKRILPSIAEDEEFIRMFIDEAKIAVQLTHANIAQILDLGKVGDAYFIAMEYVHGKDLRAVAERMKKQGETIPFPMCCYMMMKVCEGLDYAHNKKDASGHELNLVHRDVSPQNVLLSFDGEVKLIDFGIAKAANKAAKTQAGILKGKFGYMSPEQVRGLPLDKRSDVFSAGIVLYEILTGERLFLGESDFSTLEKVRNVEIMPPSTYNRNIPEELEQIVLKALAREVEDRYQTAMEFHDDLQSFMYTFGELFGRKEMSAYLKDRFKAEFESGQDGAAAEEVEGGAERPSRKASTPPPPPRRSTPPPPPRLSRTGTGLRGSVPPPPPKARASVPPPPLPKKTMLGMPAPAMPPAPVDVPQADAQMAAPAPAAHAQPAPSPMGATLLAPAAAPPAPQIQASRAAPPGGGAQIAGPPPIRPPSPSTAAPAQAAPSPAPAQEPEGLDMEWEDDEMETHIYDKLPEDEKIPGIGDGPEARPAAPTPQQIAVARAVAATPASGPIPARPAPIPMPVVAPRRSSSAALVVVPVLIVAALIIGGLIIFLVGRNKPATLVLIPEPSGATVTVDSEPVTGPFPVTLEVKPGQHVIVASHDGYETMTMELELDPGKVSTQQLTLLRKKPKGTGFILETEPLGADVVINNRPHSEKTPVTVSDLKPGTYTVRVEKAGFLPFSIDIKVADGELQQLKKVVLDPKTVFASVSSTPSGAKLTLLKDGKTASTGSTPMDVELDSASKYSLEVVAEGHEKWTQDIAIPKGQNKLAIEAKLIPLGGAAEEGETETGGDRPGKKKIVKKQPGEKTPIEKKPPEEKKGNGFLSVSTQPWTIVYVDKKKVKNTPLMKYSLPAGQHTVTLLNNDFNINKTYTVIIAAGQETRIIKNLTE